MCFIIQSKCKLYKYKQKMSLTLFFAVLSVGIGYLLYETFKKSRQVTTKPSENANQRLRIMHSQQCSILKSLQQSKKQSIKTRTISIHINCNDGINQSNPTSEELDKIRQILLELVRARRLYLLQRIGEPHNEIHKVAKEVIGKQFVIPYHSYEGAVAVLRQLGCGLHLESNQQLYIKIKQYLNKIWFVGTDQNQQALRQFKTEVEMMQFLANLQNSQKQK